MSYLKLKNIFKSYYLGKTEFPVLKGISLDFELGEFVSILGESGGGKSTLMNIIGGLDRNFDGEVVVDGGKLDHNNERKLDIYRRKTIGYIFQSFNLINYETNLKNVETSLRMTTLDSKERKKRATELLQQVGLGDQINKYPSQLSGGQKQRVAIARALASNPDILIADEPTGALDSANTQEVLNLLEQIAKDGKLVIVVTHSQDVANYGTRILHMKDGQIDEEINLRAKYTSQSKSVFKFKSRTLLKKSLWRMAFDHLKFKKIQNAIITIGGAIGIFSVLLFLGLGNGINGYINKQVNSLIKPNYLTIVKNVTTNKKASASERINATQNERLTNYQATIISNSAIKKIGQVEHVAKVYKSYQFSNATYKFGSISSKAGGQIQSWTPLVATKNIKFGRMATADNEIVIDKTFAKKVNKKWKLSIGKTISYSYNAFSSKNMPIQINGSAKVVGISDGGQNGAMGILAFNQIHQELMKANAITEPNNIIAKVDQTKNVKSAVVNINAIKSNKKQAVATVSIGDMLQTVSTITDLASYILAAIAGISLLVSALMIIVTTYMSVAERTKEIGVLRALGGRAKDVQRLFRYETILIGLISAGIALGLAFGIQRVMNTALNSMIHYNIVQISLGNSIFAVIISLLIAVLAAHVPSRKAAHLNTIDALAAE